VAVGGGVGFDVAEAALKLGVGAAQCGFRVGAEFAGQVDAGEQQIAEFVFEPFGVGRCCTIGCRVPDFLLTDISTPKKDAAE
tara:strand:- start:5206 stop:5451 length:246 start_codon:yes stop_codon:yes gene_type:complete